MQVTVHDAESNLSKLIEAALRGEEILIADGETAVVMLVPMPPKTKFKMGILPEGALGEIPDFLEPMSEDDLALWEGSAERGLA